MRRTFKLSIPLPMILAAAVNAQPLPDAGLLLRQQEQLEKGGMGHVPEAQRQEPVRPAIREAEALAVDVKAIRFSGAADLVPESELQAQVSDAIGKKLDFEGLQGLADKVSAYLKSKGYFLARAYLPRQDVTSGIIELVILQGRLDGANGEGGWRIDVAEGARIAPGRLAAMAEDAMPSGAVLQEAEFERALLLMDDLPGVTVRSRLEPGNAPGSTRVVVEVNEEPRPTGTAWLDNYGTHSTGTTQASASLNLNNPGGYGDQARLALTASEGVKLARAGYGFPVGVAGLRADLGYTAMKYEVKNGSGVAAGLQGESATAHAGLSYPIIRSRKLSLYASASYDHKALKDDSILGALRSKRVDVVNMGLAGDSLDALGGGGLNNMSLRLTTGRLDLSRVAADKAADAASLRTDGGYKKLSWSVSRLQRLSDDFTLQGRFSGQMADGNLDSSEQFLLGGPGGVRAYPGEEAPGDEGWLVNLDLRYDVPGSTPLGNVQLTAFLDAGGIRLHKDPGSVVIATATGKNRYQLGGAGLGVSVGKYGSHRLSLVWAQALGNNAGRSVSGANADGTRDASRIWLQAVASF